MKFANALSDFLYDKKYFITVFDNNVHVFRYIELLKLSSSEINIRMNDFILSIKGKDLMISQMNNEEMLITGIVIEMEKVYE